MTKKHFIQLADAIREHNRLLSHITGGGVDKFSQSHLDALADFCRSQNSAFMRERWMDYIAGECGPSGGAIKKKKA